MDLFALFTALTVAVCLGWALGRRACTPPRSDADLGALGADLRRLTELVSATARERAESFGMLSAQIRSTGEQTARLAESTAALREALASARARGQWGERMAEDVLRVAGFVEGVNYLRQRALPAGGMPDFTFPLPGGRVLHMDVKFPLDNYLAFLRAEREDERAGARKRFLHDVRICVRDLADRAYADPQTAVDCVLLFIPNEQLFAFVQEHDPALLDEALARKIVCCSPMTLFAVLAVVRQAVEHFHLERASDEALTLLAHFGAQWEKFTTELDRLGQRLDTVRRAYDELNGPRRRQLERPLDRIASLRRGAAQADTAYASLSASASPSSASVFE